jgi:hypothetical protein
MRLPGWAMAVLMLSACPGALEDPERFIADEVGEEDEGPPCDFAETCAGSVCHSGGEPAGGLDLFEPGALARMVDAPSATCEGRLLVDSQEPERSFLLEKVADANPECGGRMPPIGSGLDAAAVACVEDLIRRLIEQHGRGAQDAGAAP